jgi:transcriptional regulator of acetoin/glycerol metabolism
MPRPLLAVGKSEVGLSLANGDADVAPTPAQELDHLPSRFSRSLANEIDACAPTPMTICFVGASGTGKTGLSRRVHERSSRRGQPFVSLDLASTAPSLVRSDRAEGAAPVWRAEQAPVTRPGPTSSAA